MAPAAVCDALVIGAGAAGVGAARALRDAGLASVVVLEARQRIGGRAHTSDELDSGVPLDHGAQWVHGYSKQHPMIRLSSAAGIELLREGRTSCETVDGSGGVPVNNRSRRLASLHFRHLESLVRSHASGLGEGDCSWGEALLRARGRQLGDAGGQAGEAAADAELDTALSSLVAAEGADRELQRALLHLEVCDRLENYEGARMDRWSVKNGHKATCLDGPNAELRGGYGNLIAELGQGLDLRLGHRVTAIEYPTDDDDGPGGSPQVSVHCAVAAAGVEGEEEARRVYTAPRCVVALPLGVLRSGSVRFHPELPAPKASSMAALGVALMDKVEVLWDRRWWPEGVGSIRIASRASMPCYHPWPWFLEPPAARQHTLGWAVLVCFVTGQFAEEVEAMEDGVVADACVAALRRAHPGVSVPEPRAVHVTRWGRDVHALGSWTYYAAGSGPPDSQALAEPVGLGGCVAFAGEHTCDGSASGLDIGTVHGAWLSGVRAARGLGGRLAGKGRRGRGRGTAGGYPG